MWFGSIGIQQRVDSLVLPQCQWDDVSGFWLDEVTEFLVCSSDLDKIIKVLSHKYKEALTVHGVSDQISRIWGKAYKTPLMPKNMEAKSNCHYFCTAK